MARTSSSTEEVLEAAATEAEAPTEPAVKAPQKSLPTQGQDCCEPECRPESCE